MKVNMNISKKEQAKILARQLRKTSTKTERIFWELVRNRRFDNFKFYRQKVIFYEYLQIKKFFIADFYCHEKKLIIEIDGPIHELQRDYDQNREEILKSLDLRLIRFTNEDIENQIESVVSRLSNALETAISSSLLKRGILGEL